MNQVSVTIVAAAVVVSLLGCSAQAPAPADASTASAPSAVQGTQAAADAAAEPAPGPAAANGSAGIQLAGTAVAVSGEFAASLCGAHYILGEGVVYQADADGWKVTIATEKRTAGDIALTRPDGGNQVIATVSKGDRHFVRKPSLGGSFTISDDFKRSEADLELVNVIGRDTARLQATFVCM